MIALFHGLQSHSSVEHIAAGEIKYCIGKLFGRVILYINSVMEFIFELADPHIRLTAASFGGSRHSQMISEKALLSQSLNQLGQQIALVFSVFSSDKYIHITTSGFSTAIRSTNLNLVGIPTTNYFEQSLSHNFEHNANFFTRNPYLKILQIFQPDLLIFCEGIRVPVNFLPQFFYGFYSSLIKFLGLGSSDPPDSSQLF